MSIHKSKKCLFYVLSTPRNSRMTLKGIICLNLCLRNAEFIELSLSVRTLIYEQCHVSYENEKVNFRREKVF